MGRPLAVVLLGCALGSLGACKTAEPVVCTEIFVYGLNVQIVDATGGAPRAEGATMTLRDGTYEEIVTSSFDGLVMSGAGERAGNYDVTIERAGYATWTRNGVVVTADECHVIPVNIVSELQPEP